MNGMKGFDSPSNFSMGFVNEGVSETEYTGATWYDCIYTYD